MQYAKENQDYEDIRYRKSFFFQDATSRMTTRRPYNPPDSFDKTREDVPIPPLYPKQMAPVPAPTAPSCTAPKDIPLNLPFVSLQHCDDHIYCMKKNGLMQTDLRQ
jgi:hypothetical protein